MRARVITNGTCRGKPCKNPKGLCVEYELLDTVAKLTIEECEVMVGLRREVDFDFDQHYYRPACIGLLWLSRAWL